jgi:hypothetical protein
MCFVLNHLKEHLEKVRDVAMLRNNHMELDKITLDGWVDVGVITNNFFYQVWI